MSSQTVDRDLASHLEALRQERGDSVRIDEIGDIVRSLLTTLSGDISAGDLKLYQEIEGLALYIHKAKAEIAALRPRDIQNEFIASATDELDAIVGATENATNEILDAAEKLEELSGEFPPEISARLSDVTTRIFEACNFQDITGQRITKVVRALKHIEERVEALVSAFGPELQEQLAQSALSGAGAAAAESPVTDEDLLNGPQLPDMAHDQAAIDALFND
ncbi:chemotaxis regulator CheZ [mine drainage metagenome]|uniref:Chemotaxis regulator CheZ n=1 Tax=mine drainage metagenome TaxID=410659 RepID=A0A1J5RP32_9ZZZZ